MTIVPLLKLISSWDTTSYVSSHTLFSEFINDFAGTQLSSQLSCWWRYPGFFNVIFLSSLSIGTTWLMKRRLWKPNLCFLFIYNLWVRQGKPGGLCWLKAQFFWLLTRHYRTIPGSLKSSFATYNFFVLSFTKSLDWKFHTFLLVCVRVPLTLLKKLFVPSSPPSWILTVHRSVASLAAF